MTTHTFQPPPLIRRLAAEALGTGLLVAAVVGSGIMAQRLSPTNPGQALLENTIATAGALFVLIAALGPLSGAHFNPIVSAIDAWYGGLPRRDLLPYTAAQIVGACAGAVLANLMFGLAAVNVSTHQRSGSGVAVSEIVATFGLILVIFGLVRQGRTTWVPGAVAAYIAAAYWFTASTSFANPAVTIGRTLSNTFAGIDPTSVPTFVTAQVIGGFIAAIVVLYLWPRVGEGDAAAIDVQPETI
jgi:glycerol uptake facilitator-like aquaporin